MRDKLGSFVVGLIVGLATYHLVHQRHRTDSLSGSALGTAQTSQDTDQKISRDRLETPQSTKPIPTKEFQLVKGQPIEVPRSQSSPEQPRKIEVSDKTQGLRIEEDVVSELEAEKDMLRQRAYVEQVEDGWKVHILEKDRALIRTGLTDGDIITHDSIDTQMQMPEREALVVRFVALLRYIER